MIRNTIQRLAKFKIQAGKQNEEGEEGEGEEEMKSNVICSAFGCVGLN